MRWTRALLTGALGALALGAWAQAKKDEWPLTTAESSDFTKTSSYADVIGFLRALQLRGAPMHLRFMGTSAKGRLMPLVICHSDPYITPEMARRRGLPVVYIQANIHGGEVEGKEVVLMLLRDFARNSADPLFRRLVLVMTPIYNIDGNDAWGPNRTNRGHQDGPEPVGERANGQGLDLNRDCIKARTPEMRAVLEHVYGHWDPEVVMDLHTTNGTRHGYELTYSPGLNPTTDGRLFDYTVRMLDTIRRDPRLNGGFSFFDYGDAAQRAGKWQFATFASEPRYVTNYAAVRNRIAVLSEAASFQPFKTRVLATHRFVRAVLELVAKDAMRVNRLVRDADTRIVDMGSTPDKRHQVGVRYELASRGTEKVMIEIERPAAEIDRMKAPTQFRVLDMEIFDRFKVNRTATFPAAYVVPAAEEDVAALLVRHGITVERIESTGRAAAERFRIAERRIANAPFQGARLQSLEGKHEGFTANLTPGDFLVRTRQPLGLLAFHMLEPESTDGVLAWGLLGEPLPVADHYPIVKLMAHPAVQTTDWRPPAADSGPGPRV